MPHLVILYTGNLDAETDMTALCRSLADTMLAAHDDAGKPVFPTGGTRVLAYPAPHFAVADGGAAGRAAGGDFRDRRLRLRLPEPAHGPRPHRRHAQARGRCAADGHQGAFPAAVRQRHIGVTLQIDEGHEVFDAKHSNLHPLFNK